MKIHVGHVSLPDNVIRMKICRKNNEVIHKITAETRITLPRL